MSTPTGNTDTMTQASTDESPMADAARQTYVLRIGLGRTRVAARTSRLGVGDVVELDVRSQAPIELLCDERVIGRGQALEVDDKIALRLVDVTTRQGQEAHGNA